MKEYSVMTNAREMFTVAADKFLQTDCYVSFYAKGEDGIVAVVALVCLDAGGCVVEKREPAKCHDCGHTLGERGEQTSEVAEDDVENHEYLLPGKTVVLTVPNSGDKTYAVETCEVHNGLVFYRLRGTSGLFLKSFMRAV